MAEEHERGEGKDEEGEAEEENFISGRKFVIEISMTSTENFKRNLKRCQICSL